MNTGINESKTSIKHLSFKCKCRFDGIERNSDQKINGGILILQQNVDVNVENNIYVKKIMLLPHVITKMESIQQLLRMIQQLCVMKLQNHVMKTQKSKDETNFNENKATCKTIIFNILLAFLINTVAFTIQQLLQLLVFTVILKNIEQYKHLIPFHFTSQITN